MLRHNVGRRVTTLQKHCWNSVTNRKIGTALMLECGTTANSAVRAFHFSGIRDKESL